MRLIQEYIEEPTRCAACGATRYRGPMLRVGDDSGRWFCLLKCAADYSFAGRTA